MGNHLLEVRDLSVRFHTAQGMVNAVNGISWHLDRGETLAILGESGSGKSVSASAIMNLIDTPPGEITAGQILFDGVDLLQAAPEMRRRTNGKRISMIFQDPLSHLNPVYPVGWQIAETALAHGWTKTAAYDRALSLMARVGIPDPQAALSKYPHEFSGGQRQRLMIAMALMLKPEILIADEPTTALDVTVQAEVLSLLEELKAETGMGLVLITHDLGVVADAADRAVVMEGGRIVEAGTPHDLYHNPKHPYTQKLLAAAPGKVNIPDLRGRPRAGGARRGRGRARSASGARGSGPCPRPRSRRCRDGRTRPARIRGARGPAAGSAGGRRGTAGAVPRAGRVRPTRGRRRRSIRPATSCRRRERPRGTSGSRP